MFGQFLKNFEARASLSKLVNIGTFRKILGSINQKRISQNSTKGDPLSRQRNAPPPKSVPVMRKLTMAYLVQFYSASFQRPDYKCFWVFSVIWIYFAILHVIWIYFAFSLNGYVLQFKIRAEIESAKASETNNQ